MLSTLVPRYTLGLRSISPHRSNASDLTILGYLQSYHLSPLHLSYSTHHPRQHGYRHLHKTTAAGRGCPPWVTNYLQCLLHIRLRNCSHFVTRSQNLLCRLTSLLMRMSSKVSVFINLCTNHRSPFTAHPTRLQCPHPFSNLFAKQVFELPKSATAPQ